jgi:hypothetical protein
METPDAKIIKVVIPEVWRERFSKLKYGTVLANFFALMLEPGASEEDAIEFAAFIEEKLKVTIEELDAQIQIGIDNGYAADDQLLIMQKVLGLPTN